MLRQEVLAEQALRELPVGRELTGLLHQGVNPGDTAGLGFILDAVAGLGIVFHDLPGTASAADVQLEEDDVFLGGDTQLVFVDKVLNNDGIEDGEEEGDEIRVEAGADAAEDDVRRDEAGGHGKCLGALLFQPIDFLVAPVGAWFALGMIPKEFPGRVVVVAGGVVVAFSDGGVQRLSLLVDVEREAVCLPAGRARVP